MDGEGMCTVCWGRGGKVLRQDPVGDGRGYEVLVDPCPDCLGQGRCPWCGAALAGGVRAERCDNDECRWTAERIG
ncbi:MAG TPA: hypothetical protein VFS21_02530, partial [Roseiflexaceae bacterium]|nr:hypothetical protein [Roseiflexaceae bacterium]